ncbi:site-specific integrase [Mycolicibacterium hodleri]|uniref:site-specific integrase n=1 Tax=Mycolicibacterium hodleri TaxID=49897 RepID=UPI0021F2928A|nr:site-specific integrase [Mycolicibacterium hodleri]
MTTLSTAPTRTDTITTPVGPKFVKNYDQSGAKSGDHTQKPAETFTPAELQTVLDHVDGQRYAIAWQLALTGLRRGEVAGLRWVDVDLENRTLQIASTRLRFGKHLVEDTPKSRAGRRTLPIPDHLAAALRSARAIQAADRLMLGEEYEASGFVVVDEWGTALSPHALTSRWARMLKAAGVRHIRYHDARHTCGTLMHLQDVPIAVISAWLGHSSVNGQLEVPAGGQIKVPTACGDS